MVDAGGGNGVLQQLNKVNVFLSDIHNLFLTHAHTDHVLGAVWVVRLVMQLMWQDKYNTRVRDNIQKSKEQKNIQPTKGGHKMVTCQNYVSLFYCQITSCPSDGGIS